MGCSPCKGREVTKLRQQTFEYGDDQIGGNQVSDIIYNWGYEEVVMESDMRNAFREITMNQIQAEEKGEDSFFSSDLNNNEKEQLSMKEIIFEKKEDVDDEEEPKPQEPVMPIINKEKAIVSENEQKDETDYQNILNIFPNLSKASTELILFKSTLLKMINISYKKIQSYIERFCFITREAFVIFKSKEAFFGLQPPLGILPINEIEKVVSFKIKPTNKKYDHFYISFKKTVLTEKFYEQINKCFLEKNTNEALVMFRSENINIIKKWVSIIKYLINDNKLKIK